ncbi:MAG: acetate--CoA ligase family protein, partial [candidate division Zixibacteria bacterium]|nr:acetate--CoA ligase family protein [candidate division Zixibacteria bacterium]
MKVHEYQAKQIFEKAGIPVPPGNIATTPTEAFEIAEKLNKPVMIKAQVHVGGRGKAGGVKYAENAEAAKVLAQKILGMDIKGLTVKKVLVTEAVEIISEAYIGIILDRTTQKPVIMVSSAGGVDIEEVAAKTPEKIHKLYVDPVVGLREYQARNLAYKLFRETSQVRKTSDIIMKLYDIFWQVDASLVEINPLISTPGGEVLAIDAKLNVDDNGLFRHKNIAAMRDLDAEDQAEIKAREADLSYV